jgi:hypothetical protein
MGCLPKLPSSFPLEHPENAGNMVHANAPFSMFDNAFFIKDDFYKAVGFVNFRDFVNEKCSHLIVTLANTFKLDDEDGTKYKRLLDFLLQINKPIVIFGLGIQSKNADINSAKLPSEAIELIRYLSTKSPLLGVRGEFTKKVLSRICNVDNIYVTGCPSLFSRPNAFGKLRINIKENTGQPAFSGTKLFDDIENRILTAAINKDYWLIEPVNKHNHSYYLKIISNTDTFEDIPYFLKRKFNKESYDSYHPLRRYFLSRYKLFRNINDWYQFNSEAVSYSFGTRFHVNMATLLSGKPALWITHDDRTRELTEFLHLPNIDIASPILNDISTLAEHISYENFFDNVQSLFENFNFYLEANNLPKVKFQF